MSPLDADPAIRARDTAFRLLTRREHSRAELRSKLCARGYDGELVDELLEVLQAESLLSDERFAQSLVSHRTSSGYGPFRIVMELKDKGVAPEIVERAVSAAEVDWDQLLQDQHDRKFGSSRASSFKEWARRAQYLKRRGFSTDAIRCVMGSWDSTAADAGVQDDPDADMNR